MENVRRSKAAEHESLASYLWGGWKSCLWVLDSDFCLLSRQKSWEARERGGTVGRNVPKNDPTREALDLPGFKILLYLSSFPLNLLNLRVETTPDLIVSSKFNQNCLDQLLGEALVFKAWVFLVFQSELSHSSALWMERSWDHEGGSRWEPQQMEVVLTPPLVSSSSVCRESYNRWHGCKLGLEIVNYLPNMILHS